MPLSPISCSLVLGKKFAIDHHSSLNCFANCFSTVFFFLYIFYLLFFFYFLHFLFFFCVRVLTSRFLSPAPASQGSFCCSACPCCCPFFVPASPSLGTTKGSASALVFATLPKFDEFLFYSFWAPPLKLCSIFFYFLFFSYF